MNFDLLLLSFSEIFNDFNLILKIFALMTIYSWVKNHIQNATMGLVIFGAVVIFVFGELWVLFGGIFFGQ